MEIEIDNQSGFCFGVVNAIQQAEKELEGDKTLYCLGDIVHNGREVERLEKMGLVTINHEQFAQLYNATVLLRAHGEPPSTYEIAKRNNITIVDATCPVVLKLQKKIKGQYDELQDDTQIVIFGKVGHAEVNGLVGQTEANAIVIENITDLNKLDYAKNIRLFSQTTKSVDEFNAIVEEIKNRLKSSFSFEYNDTICRQVANRIPNIRKFAAKHDVVLFVSGKKSSNGKILFQECKNVNENTFFISDITDIQKDWFAANINSIGICGATSTPKWLMEDVEKAVKNMI